MLDTMKHAEIDQASNLEGLTEASAGAVSVPLFLGVDPTNGNFFIKYPAPIILSGSEARPNSIEWTVTWQISAEPGIGIQPTDFTSLVIDLQLPSQGIQIQDLSSTGTEFTAKLLSTVTQSLLFPYTIISNVNAPKDNFDGQIKRPRTVTLKPAIEDPTIVVTPEPIG